MHSQPKKTVLLFGADHTGVVRMGEVFDTGCWETPVGDVEIDEPLGKQLLNNPSCDGLLRSNPSAHSHEHSLEVLLPLIATISPGTKILPIAIPPDLNAANIGITPMNDGRLIRVPVPELSEDRRKDLVKVAGRATEEQRVAVRNVRREANEQLKSLQKNSKITEDDRDESLEEVQKLTDDHIKKMDSMLIAKEKEVMAV